MAGGYLPVAASLLCLMIGAAQPAMPQTQQTGPSLAAAHSGIDRYLDDRYQLLQPPRLPNAAEVAMGCDSASSDAIRELESGGAIVDPSYDQSVVRGLECRPAADEPRIAACRFRKASIPLHAAMDGEKSQRDYVARLRERDWGSAAARIALVAWANPKFSSEPRWIATDTCEPFVFKGDGWEIDPREMARQRRRAD